MPIAAFDAGGEAERMKVVLVEDRASISLAPLLECADHELVVVGSSADALPVLSQHDLGVCVVRGRDELATVAAIRADAHALGVPIVLLTERELDPAYVELAYASGASDVVRLPIKAAILLAKLAVFANLQRHRAREVSRREVELAALQAQFLASLGQELRPPLNAIVGWVRMLKDGSIREPQRARALETVERSALEQLELIEEMLDVSRMTSHSLTLDLVVVDLRRIVEEVVEALRPPAIEKQLTLFAAVDDDVAPMFADPERLRQIAHRLVKNAVVSTPTEGVVTVSLRNCDSRVELAITDAGVKDEAGVAHRVFDGFAIVRHLVELHDGTISIEDGETGRRFIVSLPAAGRPPRTDDEAR
jgi:signal transduction histidine kinase